VDWLWRGFGSRLFKRLDRQSDVVWGRIVGGTTQAARHVAREIYRHHGPDGVLARTWRTGSMALWTTIMLAAFLVLSYL
jgi:multicomponent Na+:H+ antiporter subunit D